MVEGCGVNRRTAEARVWVAAEIFRHWDQHFYLQVAIRAQRFQRFEVRLSAQEQGVIHRHEIPAIINQRTHLVDQPRAILRQVHNPLAGGCKERRIEKDAVEAFPGTFQTVDLRPKIPGLEIRPDDGKAIEAVGRLREVEEFLIPVEVQDARSPAGARCHAQAAGVGKRIQDRLAPQVFDCPFTQVPRIQVETGVLVHQQVNGIPNPVFLHAASNGLPIDDRSLFGILRQSMARFQEDGLNPGKTTFE